MSTKRILTTAMALLLIAAIPARATSVPTLTVIDTINPGADSSSPLYFTPLGDYLYFRAIDGTHGRELWRTNGTTTTLVADINSGGNNSDPGGFTALGDFLYFRATDATHGRELWRTDGTVTERVPFPVAGQSIDCEMVYSCIPSIVAVGGRLYTTVYSDAIGLEFAYLDEPTYVLPPTNRDGSLWTATLVILAGLTAAASIGLRLRGARRA